MLFDVVVLIFCFIEVVVTSLQSGCRPCYSTDVAVLRVLSDLLKAVDEGNVAVLVRLDSTAAFDTVDHEI